MRYIFYTLMISVLIISCKEKEIKTEIPQTEQAKRDSLMQNNYDEHKSIHQQEWEEHQKDTLKVE